MTGAQVQATNRRLRQEISILHRQSDHAVPPRAKIDDAGHAFSYNVRIEALATFDVAHTATALSTWSESMLPQPMEATLARWHEMVAARNLSELSLLLADDVVFRSPFAYTPYVGVAKVNALLSTVIQVFTDFAYHRQLVDGDSVGLEFSAKVGDLSLKGIDLIQFDTAGRIVDFEVMIRPANALLALGQEMGKRLAEQGIKP